MPPPTQLCRIASASLIASALAASGAEKPKPVSEPGAAERRAMLTATWRVQPATRSTQEPTADWVTVGTGTWSWQAPLRRHPAWKGTSTRAIGSLWYAQTVRVPKEWKGDRIVLNFRRIEGDAIVFWNGQRVAELLRPGGEVEVTPAVDFGSDNELRVFLTRDYTDTSRGFEQDPLRYRTRGPEGRKLPMGSWGLAISAPVDVMRRPTPAAFSDVFVQTSWREKRLTAACTLEATAPVTGVRIEAIVTDANGNEALRFAGEDMGLATGTTTKAISSAWPNPIPWELDAPCLYTLQVRLLGPNGELDSLPPERFGFREIWTEGRHVYLNGHVSRWRIEWTSFGLNENSIPFLKLLGRNVVYQQNNPTAWWCDWSETPYLGDELLALLDETGVGLLQVAPNVANVRGALLDDPALRRDYERETALWVRRYRNHPCVLAWSVSMNSFNPRDAIHPDTMGQRSNYGHPQAKVIATAAAMVKDNDPTRLVYGHADGNLTDIASANNYPNFMPIQEVEDYPSIWAAKGNMPYFAAEFALPYGGSWYKRSQFLGTEYAAILFGNEAYRQEPEALLQQTLEIGLGNKGHGNSLGTARPIFPMYWEVRRQYVTRTDRAWRTWGVQGWHYFNFGAGYGDPPGAKSSRFNRYSVLKKPVTERPDWANPNFDIHSEAMQPLLVYLAGTPEFTDKTHTFLSPEEIHKQIAVVWDGPGTRRLTARWRLEHNSALLGHGEATLRVAAGEVAFAPIVLRAPQVKERMDFELKLAVSEEGEDVAHDSLTLTVFPRPPASLALPERVALWDPAGKSRAWLDRLGVDCTPIEPGDGLGDYRLLIVGREALTPGAALPYTPADVARGLNVIVCAQLPGMWEGLGFMADDLQSRRVFIGDPTSPIVAGLRDVDLRDWRGTPDLLPEFRRTFDHDALRAPKSSNRHTVASVVLRVPAVVGFTPILNCEFDLDYSPLLQWRYGHGVITFCTIDFTGRDAQEPVAELLARNLLRATADGPREPTRTTVVSGQDDLSALGVSSASATGRDPKSTLYVLSSDAAPDDAALLDAVRRGARAVVLPHDADALAKAGYSTVEKSAFRVPPPQGKSFAAVGPRLLRWRDSLPFAAFTRQGQPAGSTVAGDGLFLTRRLGKGNLLFVQADPGVLARRYEGDRARQEAIRLSVFRLQQLTARLLTNAGATASDTLARRLCQLQAGAAYEELKTWHVLGPYAPESKAAGTVLAAVFPGEEAAIAGDTNPNITYRRADGTQLDFRKTVSANADGFVDLGAALRPEGMAVAYVTRAVNSAMARRATLRLGVDYWMQVWLNGTLVYRLDHGHGSPKPNRHLVDLDLREGENVLTIKVLSGSKGFGFWADLARPNAQDTGSAPPLDVALYPADAAYFDPYEYHYW